MNYGSLGSRGPKSSFSTKSSLLASQAIFGFLQYKTAEGLSPNTLKNYEHALRLWSQWVDDKPVHQFTAEDLRSYFAWLRTEYKPQRFSGDDRPLAPKSLRNAYIGFCAFFTWASKEFTFTSPMKSVPAPKFEDPPIEPFKQDEVERLLKATEYMKEAATDRRKKFVMRRSTAKRDRAIVLFLLDTGLRAGELCSLTIGDVEQKLGRVQVKHGVAGGAKGGKGRIVYIGKATRTAVWRYLVSREDANNPTSPLFLGKNDRPLNKTALRLMIGHLGVRANVQKCYPHRFRHTFAITYLRNSGDLFTLQALLGHSTLEMVQHYARIAEVDVADAHRRASPADNWHL